MADKIDQLKIGNTSYDIDLPPDATPSIASITVSGPTNTAGTEQTTAKFATSNGGSITLGKEGPNSGTMIRLDQTDGTCRLRFRASATAGAMVWEQPENSSRLYMDFKDSNGTTYRVNSPTTAGTLATQEWVNGKGYTTNTGTVTSVSAGTGLSISGTASTTPTINIKSGYKLLTTSEYNTLNAKQNALPTTATAGKVLKSTATAGTVEWADDANTDTKNTAGTTNKTATKMYLVGATEQSDNPKTYSNSNAYIGTDNCLYSNGTKVLTSHQSIKTLKTDNTDAQTASSSEAISGSGTINLHKIAKTGTYGDLIGTPIPGDSGEIKTKYRCALKGYTGSGNSVWYYKLVKLPTDNSGNYASAIINGRIGGWTASGMSAIYCLIWNRDGVGLSLLELGGTGTMSSIFDTVDLVVYKNSDNTADIYIKCKDYFTFDLDVEVYQSTATITYDGTYITTTPSGTESGKASTSTNRLELEQGVLKVNGTAVGYKIIESLRKGSEADTAVGYYKIATINHYNWNFCDFCMLVKNSYAGVAYSTIFNCSCSDSNVDLRNFKLNIISGTDISDKLAYLYTYDSNNNLIKVEVFIHATRFEHPMCYIINARPGQQLVIPTQDEFNKATPDKPDGTTMTGYATYAIVSVGTSGQLLSSNGSSLVWTNDNRGLLHHDLTKEIENTTTDNGWSMFNDTYNGFLLKSLRFNASSPLWGIGDYGSGIVFGGGDTKGVISLSWRLAQIKFAGGNSGNGGPVWWIGLNGTSTTTYDLDKLRAKPDRVTGSKTYNQANLTSLYNLIEAHKDIKFWTYKYTSGSDRTDMYSLMYNASYSGVLGTYSVNFYYINGGTVTELSSGTVYYEYLK